MLIELAVALVAVAFTVLVGFLVPTLVQLRKTVAESQQLVAGLKADVPVILKEVRGLAENVGGIADQARDSVEHASVFLHAVGEVGESVQQVHKAVRGKSTMLLVRLASVLAGVRAASSVVKERAHKDSDGNLHQEGGRHDGKR